MVRLHKDTACCQLAPDQIVIMSIEEDDALDWKIARDMVQSWLGLQREVLR